MQKSDRRWGYALQDDLDDYEATLTENMQNDFWEEPQEVNPYVLESLRYEYLMEEMFDIINSHADGGADYGAGEAYETFEDKYFSKSRDYERW